MLQGERRISVERETRVGESVLEPERALCKQEEARTLAQHSLRSSGASWTALGVASGQRQTRASRLGAALRARWEV